MPLSRLYVARKNRVKRLTIPLLGEILVITRPISRDTDMARAFRLTPIEAPEHSIQKAVLRYLSLDRRVAWAHRFNTAAVVIDDSAAAKARLIDSYAGRLHAARSNAVALTRILAEMLRAYFAIRRGSKRFLRAAFPGCSDVLGQLHTGHFFAVEVKRPSTGPTTDQQSFLDQVNDAGGLAIVARRVEDVQRALDEFYRNADSGLKRERGLERVAW